MEAAALTRPLPETEKDSAGATAGSVLVIEDDPHIQRSVSYHLARHGYQVTASSDGEEGLKFALAHSYQVIVLDLMLPKVDGMTICRKVREHNPRVPILIVTARGSELDRVTGLELGADDYICKPFGPAELEARIRAVLRRLDTQAQTGRELVHGPLRLDCHLRQLYIGDHVVRLTGKEFELLLLLFRNPGRLFPRAAILPRIWGQSYDGYHRNVDALINRLRSKMETYADVEQPWLECVYGLGYRLNLEAIRPPRGLARAPGGERKASGAS